jgi:hypothetical protein
VCSGFAFGDVNLYDILQIVQHDIAGMRLDYAFPVHNTNHGRRVHPQALNRYASGTDRTFHHSYSIG